MVMSVILAIVFAILLILVFIRHKYRKQKKAKAQKTKHFENVYEEIKGVGSIKTKSVRNLE